MNPIYELKRQALAESTEYARQHMMHAIQANSTKEGLDIGLEHVSIDGQFLEFGVFRGSSITYIAKRVGRSKTVNGFDSFRGLPEVWSGTKFDFDVGGQLPRVPANVILHAGLFDQSLPEWAKKHQEDIAFLHIDCDLYASTKIVFDLLGSRIKPGTIIVFDEYFNYPGWQDHEFKAFQEFIANSGLTYTYLGFSRFQAVVKITK
jgi:predicted O-methyltransferase YrrM